MKSTAWPFTTLVPLLLLGGCGEGMEADEMNRAAPYNMIPPTTVEAAPGQPGATPGQWRTPGGASRLLAFAAEEGDAVFRLSCDDRGGLVMERLGVESRGDIEMMEVSAGGEAARLALNEPETPEPVLRASVPFNHALMEALRRPQGLLSVKAGDAEPLELPLGPETAGLLATCERPDPA